MLRFLAGVHISCGLKRFSEIHQWPQDYAFITILTNLTPVLAGQDFCISSPYQCTADYQLIISHDYLKMHLILSWFRDSMWLIGSAAVTAFLGTDTSLCYWGTLIMTEILFRNIYQQKNMTIMCQFWGSWEKVQPISLKAGHGFEVEKFSLALRIKDA